MELGVMGMMLKTKPTAGHRFAMLAAMAQAALLLFWSASASAQEGNRLQDIQVQSLPGERVELKLIMSDTAPQPLDFTIENPARIAGVASPRCQHGTARHGPDGRS
jgi:type IV pilus assembly protein PilQ